MSIKAGNRASPRKRLRGHQKQSVFGQRRGRGFLVGDFWVGSIDFSHHEADGFELMGL